ncbi:7TM diverse intracellular signaling domain-containing protein [Algoriphagus formosus]|nr:7TM diverse intracellular signaling domain-containing protein [Algoriphagus aquimaris]
MKPFTRDKIEINGNGEIDYWLYFEVKSNIGHVFLSQPFLQYSSADLYEIQNDAPVLISKGGTQADSEDRYLVYPGDLYDLKISDTSTHQYLLRLNRILYKTLSAKVVSEKELIQSQHLHFLSEGIFLGIILGVAIYHLLVFIRVKEKEYLLLSIYLFFLTILLAIISGTIYGLTSFENPEWNYKIFNFISPLTSFFSLWFSIVFLDLNQNKYAREMKIYWGFQILFIANLFFSLFEIESLERLTYFTSSPASIFLLYLGFKRLKDGFKPAGIYLASYIPASIAVSILTLYTYGFLDYQWIIHNSLLIGVVLQALFFSLAIARKIRLLKEEKEQILNDEKNNLERKVSERTEDLNQSLENLKATQSQLIQAEKMASLGELTAGIAHEIQNPLNFVNNFSEISNELIEEIEEEQKKPAAERDNELIFEIIADLKQNLQKINKHGHRAGSIVKNMLEHSRISTGEKVLTDINVLADEYVKLSYHGLRAKDKSFNADLKLNLAPNLPKVKILPSEIGRVLLNLANNAFYAVSEKAKGNLEGYKPQLTLSTVKTKNGIEISVSDNGPGIPESIKDKIFQPFFTTKPSGSGTGLGLSLSYDIVKAHGGEVKVESESGKGTTFRIQIPT